MVFCPYGFDQNLLLQGTAILVQEVETGGDLGDLGRIAGPEKLPPQFGNAESAGERSGAGRPESEVGSGQLPGIDLGGEEKGGEGGVLGAAADDGGPGRRRSGFHRSRGRRRPPSPPRRETRAFPRAGRRTRFSLRPGELDRHPHRGESREKDTKNRTGPGLIPPGREGSPPSAGDDRSRSRPSPGSGPRDRERRPRSRSRARGEDWAPNFRARSTP